MQWPAGGAQDAETGRVMPAWFHAAAGDYVVAPWEAADQQARFQKAPAVTPLNLPVLALQESASPGEVREFLEQCGLGPHLDTLIRHGFDRMEALQEMREEHLEALGIPLGHRLLLMKHLRSARGSKDDGGEGMSEVFDSLELQRVKER